jgi:adenine-specific DNA-methyltransferase
MSNLKQSISNSIQLFQTETKENSLRNFFHTLGYSTNRELTLDSNNPQDFLEVLAWDNFNQENALFSQWLSVDFLFQLTDNEINHQTTLFHNFDTNYLTSYIFLTISLINNQYNKTNLSQITREINRNSDIPVMILFRYGDSLTLSIINRRPHKKDSTKDVLNKITLIKDIKINSPHRAHLEILHDLALPTIINQFKPQNFDDLHNAWQKILDTSQLNKKFFNDISNWYFYALQNVTFPDGVIQDESVRNATNIIRLITRLIFVWFIKEKGLISDQLFNKTGSSVDTMVNQH